MSTSQLPARKQPLIIGSEEQRTLSPSQKLFNKLSAEIEALNAELDAEPARLQRLFALFLKELKPSMLETGAVYLEMAETVQQKTEDFKTSKSQKTEAELLIRNLLEEAENRGAEVEDHALSNLYPPEKGEFRKANFEGEKEEGGFGKQDDSNSNRKPLLIEDQKSKIEDSYHWFKAPKKRLSKAEKERKQFELSKQKQLKSMYLALAKLLHPDTETDPVLAAEKQEYMKLVTQAYQVKDLAGLLRLELEIVHKEAAHLDRLTENRLAMYNEVLAEQIKTLKNRLDELRGNPAFYEIGAVLDLQTELAEKRIRQAARGAKEWLFYLRLKLEEMQQAGSVKDVLVRGDALF